MTSFISKVWSVCTVLIILFLTGCQCLPHAIFTSEAPKPLGPYSQAIVAHGIVYGAGQLGIDPKTGKLASPTAEGQMEQALKNMFAVLGAAGSCREKLLKVTVYFKNLDDLDRVNSVYVKYVPDHQPGRAAVQVSRIPGDGLIEIDYIAAK